MNSDIQAVTMLRNEIGAIILGTLFLGIGLISWAIAAIRRRSQIRILIRIAAGYYPMTAMAGDFYDFIPVDEFRAGFLVADVTGHGVRAWQAAAQSQQDDMTLLVIEAV
jgi:hypothetical protein